MLSPKVTETTAEGSKYSAADPANEADETKMSHSKQSAKPVLTEAQLDKLFFQNLISVALQLGLRKSNGMSKNISLNLGFFSHWMISILERHPW